MSRRNIQQPRSPYGSPRVVQTDRRLQLPRRPSEGREHGDYRLSIEEGGTGQGGRQAALDALTDVSSATADDILHKDPTTGSLVFAAVSIDLASADVTGTLPIANGGTGGTTDATAQVNIIPQYTTVNLPAAPGAGFLAYDLTLNKLTFYNGAAYEVVTSV